MCACVCTHLQKSSFTCDVLLTCMFLSWWTLCAHFLYFLYIYSVNFLVVFSERVCFSFLTNWHWIHRPFFFFLLLFPQKTPKEHSQFAQNALKKKSIIFLKSCLDVPSHKKSICMHPSCWKHSHNSFHQKKVKNKTKYFFHSIWAR